MHDQAVEVIVTDCVAYSQFNAPASILDRWSKEQMAFAIHSMSTRLRLFRDAMHRDRVAHDELCTCEGCFLRNE